MGDLPTLGEFRAALQKDVTLRDYLNTYLRLPVGPWIHLANGSARALIYLTFYRFSQDVSHTAHRRRHGILSRPWNLLTT